jgi:hypothetical protein
MAGVSDIWGAVSGWLSSGLFWLIIGIGLTIGVISLLVVNRNRKLKYNCLELINFGNGKVGINKLKAGTFKKKSIFFGLFDVGSENVYKTSDGRIIPEANSDDLHDIMNKKGFILRRKDDDPKLLVPISAIGWKNERALFEIAPADFRDASVNIVEGATKETQSWADKYLPYIMIGGIIIFSIVAFILASQFFNGAMDRALQIQKQSCTNQINAQTGSSP